MLTLKYSRDLKREELGNFAINLLVGDFKEKIKEGILPMSASLVGTFSFVNKKDENDTLEGQEGCIRITPISTKPELVVFIDKENRLETIYSSEDYNIKIQELREMLMTLKILNQFVCVTTFKTTNNGVIFGEMLMNDADLEKQNWIVTYSHIPPGHREFSDWRSAAFDTEEEAHNFMEEIEKSGGIIKTLNEVHMERRGENENQIT